MRDRCQPESTITFKEYIYYRLGKTRIYKGKLNKNKYNELLEQISSTYKIKPEINQLSDEVRGPFELKYGPQLLMLWHVYFK